MMHAGDGAFERFDSHWALDRAEPLFGGMSFSEREGDDEVDPDDSLLAMDTRTWDYDPRMSLIFGLRGEGKSAAATLLALKLRHDSWVHSNHEEIKPIVTNMNIYDTGPGEHNRVIREPQLHRLYADEEVNERLRDAIIVWDEVGETVSNLRPNARSAVSYTHLTLPTIRLV